jgi:TRAP-type transport system small permease protein
VLRALALCGGAVLLGLMGLIAFDVVMRYVLRIPFLGAYELTELAMALVVFLGLPYCAVTNGHVAMDAFDKWLDRPGFRWLQIAVALAGAAVCAVMAWQALDYALAGKARGEASNMLQIDLFPFMVVAAGSFALYCAVLLYQAWQMLRR